MIVAFETASTDVSVAVAQADGSLVDSIGWTSDRRQGHEVLPRLLDLLRDTGLAVTDITGIGIGLGPGSFTGLRVGMSLGKGLALGLDRPLVGVPSLSAWLEAEPDAVGALARAGAREAYLLLRGEPGPRLVDREGLPTDASTAPLVAPAELAAAFGLAGARSPYRAAAAVARVAASRLASGDRDDLARLEPAYLRAPRGLEQVPHAEVP